MLWECLPSCRACIFVNVIFQRSSDHPAFIKSLFMAETCGISLPFLKKPSLDLVDWPAQRCVSWQNSRQLNINFACPDLFPHFVLAQCQRWRKVCLNPWTLTHSSNTGGEKCCHVCISFKPIIINWSLNGLHPCERTDNGCLIAWFKSLFKTCHFQWVLLPQGLLLF